LTINRLVLISIEIARRFSDIAISTSYLAARNTMHGAEWAVRLEQGKIIIEPISSSIFPQRKEVAGTSRNCSKRRFARIRYWSHQYYT